MHLCDIQFSKPVVVHCCVIIHQCALEDQEGGGELELAQHCMNPHPHVFTPAPSVTSAMHEWASRSELCIEYYTLCESQPQCSHDRFTHTFPFITNKMDSNLTIWAKMLMVLLPQFSCTQIHLLLNKSVLFPLDTVCFKNDWRNFNGINWVIWFETRKWLNIFTFLYSNK